MTPRALLVFAAVIQGCSSCGPAPSAPDVGVPVTSASATASAPTSKPSASGSAPPVIVPPSSGAGGACVLAAEPAVVDKLVRADTGVSFGAGVSAIAWAKGQGEVAAATFDDAGAITMATVEDPFPALAQKPAAGVTRVIQRVVPIAASDNKVRVSVDLFETTADKRRRVQCGPAGALYVDFEGPSLSANAEGATKETVDCRTLPSSGGALESVLERDGAKLTATLRFAGVVLVKRETTLKPGEIPSERWAFTHLGAERVPAGLVVTARHNGSVIVARQAGEVLPDVGTWLGTATNRPAIAAGGEDRVEVWNTLSGKPDLYVTRFTFTKKPEAPVVSPLEPVEERGFVSALGRENDTVLLVAEKVAGKRVMVGASGAHLGALTLGGENESISEARAAALSSGKVLFAWTSTEGGKSLLKTAVGACGESQDPDASVTPQSDAGAAGD